MQSLRRSLAAVFTAALVATVAPLRAQQITGRIIDQGSGQPMAAVQVSIPGTGIGALSQATGRYLLLNVPVGTHSVTAQRIGYRTVTAQVTVTAGNTAVQDFTLAEEALGLDEIVVSGSGTRADPAAGATNDRRAIGSSIASPQPPSIAATKAEVARERRMPTRHGFVGHTESYNYIDENDFLRAHGNPLSTFAVDVDRASYANVRRFISDGQRPPVDAVRIEELINYFPYDYPETESRTPFAVHTEVASAPWAPGHRLVRIGIQGKRVHMESMPDANFVFLIDVSGSMDSPDKLPLVKESLRMLVGQLREEDRVAVVVYAGAAGLVLPSTSGHEKEKILRAIDHLEAGGSTAGGAGIRLAYDVARQNRVRGGNNRVILATDGDFNVGASSDAEMIRLIEEERRQGTFLTVLGFATGDLQDAKMEQIADHGNGNYAYIDGLPEARKVLVREMGGTLLTIAKDVKVQVEFNPARVASYRLIGYENRTMAAEDFANDRKDGGEIGAGHSVTALYEVVPVDEKHSDHVESPVPLRYQTQAAVVDRNDELLLVKLRYKDPDGNTSREISQAVLDRTVDASSDLRFAAAVAAFGMVLRDSPHRGDFELDDVLTLARSGLGRDREGYRADFLKLVREARELFEWRESL